MYSVSVSNSTGGDIDGPGVTSRFQSPVGMEVDKLADTRTLYVADSVRQIHSVS